MTSLEVEQPKRPCDICGRDCTSITGVLIQWDDNTGKCEEISNVRKIFGKTNFAVCLTCYLLSLGIRPKEGGSE